MLLPASSKSRKSAVCLRLLPLLHPFVFKLRSDLLPCIHVIHTKCVLPCEPLLTHAQGHALIETDAIHWSSGHLSHDKEVD